MSRHPDGPDPLPPDTTHLPSQVLALEGAHIAARAAWLYEGDDEARLRAARACAFVGIDYIQTLAATMEATNCDARMARREVAESLRRAAERVYTLSQSTMEG